MILDTDKQNCATCANWSDVDPRKTCRGDRGTRNQLSDKRRLCVIALHGDTYENPDPSAPWVEDGSDYYAALLTPATFACNRWRQKP